MDNHLPISIECIFIGGKLNEPKLTNRDIQVSNGINDCCCNMLTY
jgi:hypothetical protein